MSLHRPKFVRRANRNGTTDSICCKCFITVATARKECELEAPERTHVCDPTLLKYWKDMADGDRGEGEAGECWSYSPG